MRSKPTSAAFVAILLLICLQSWNSAHSTQTQKSTEAGTVIQYGQPKELCKLKDDRINESSGIAASISNQEAFWTNNDSGDSARIFLFNKNGDTLNVVNIKGITAVDWEDVASFKIGKDSYVLIADAGDNARRRNNYALYIIREPVLSLKSGVNKEAVSIEVEPVSTINFFYEDGSHDCESVAVDPTESTVYLVSKEPAECKVYSLPIPPEGSKIPNVARAIATLKMPYPTAMDISPDGMRAIVLTYGDAFEFSRASGETWARAFSREPRQIKTPPRKQGESICYGFDGKTLYLTSEGMSQPLWEMPVIENAKGSRNNNFTFCGRLSGLTIGIKLQKDLAILRVGRPSGRGGGRASAALPLLGDEPHRLRRGALHLPTRRSRQNVNLFLREP